MILSLVRHGRPAADFTTPISGRDFGGWLTDYEKAGIDPAFPPPPRLQTAMAGIGLLLCSPARRAVESAQAISDGRAATILAAAREAPLPSALWCPLRVSPAWLIVLARVLWQARLAKASEGPSAVALRAKLLAESLEQLAAEHEQVALVGHGYFGCWVGSALRQGGWRNRGPRSFGYWGEFRLEKTLLPRLGSAPAFPAKEVTQSAHRPAIPSV